MAKIIPIGDAPRSKASWATFEGVLGTVHEMAEAEAEADQGDAYVMILDQIILALFEQRRKLMKAGPRLRHRLKVVQGDIANMKAAKRPKDWDAAIAQGDRMVEVSHEWDRTVPALLARISVERRIDRVHAAFAAPKPSEASVAIEIENVVRVWAFAVSNSLPSRPRLVVTVPQAAARVLDAILSLRPALLPLAKANEAKLRTAITDLSSVTQGRRPLKGGMPRAVAQASLSKFMLSIGLGASPEGLKKRRQRDRRKRP